MIFRSTIVAAAMLAAHPAAAEDRKIRTDPSLLLKGVVSARATDDFIATTYGTSTAARR
jgi:hypothetical protein